MALFLVLDTQILDMEGNEMIGKGPGPDQIQDVQQTVDEIVRMVRGNLF
jgi:hypothetical protein